MENEEDGHVSKKWTKVWQRTSGILWSEIPKR